MPPDDIGLDDTSVTGIVHRGTHGILLCAGDVIDLRETKVQRIYTIWEDLRPNRISEACSLKGLIPVLDPLLHIGPPLRRCIPIDVEDDRMSRWYQLTCKVCSRVARGEVPAGDHLLADDVISLVGVEGAGHGEVADPRT